MTGRHAPASAARPAVAPSARTPVRVAWRVLRADPAAYAIAWVLWVAFYCFPLAVGWAFKLVLDRVAGGAPAASAWAPLALMGGLELTRWAVLVVAAVQWHGAFLGWLTLPRVNLLRSLVSAPGPAVGRLPGSPGEAVSRFRDDARDVGLVLDVWLDVSGAVVAAAGAIAVMAAIEPVVTAAVVVPVAVAVGVTRWLGPALRTWRRGAREATAAVTGLLGDGFGAVLAVKAAGAEHAFAARFAALNAARARVARKDQVGTQLAQSLSGAAGEASVGVLLLLVAAPIRRGEFTVSELGLFTSYVTVLAAVPRWAGRLSTYHRQAEVSVGRLAELLPDRDPLGPAAPVPLHLRHGPPPIAAAPALDAPLDELRVEGLRASHVRGVPVLHDVDLVVRRGELVAVTGPVGAGKSTLLRVLLGLVPRDAGTIAWNGRAVDDPSTFLVPPRTAYVPQAPRLFSESLADTVALGLPGADVATALWLACLDEDVAAMPDGPATLVGPRGTRLSGGQVQRAGAARALVRRAELLVVDDLSSALDVETEARIWDRLLGGGVRTALVVTSRPQVLARADRVVALVGGRARSA